MREKRKKAANREARKAYRAMVDRIEAKEVHELLWKRRQKAYPVKVIAGYIYLTEQGRRGLPPCDRCITPGALARGDMTEIPTKERWSA